LILSCVSVTYALTQSFHAGCAPLRLLSYAHKRDGRHRADRVVRRTSEADRI